MNKIEFTKQRLQESIDAKTMLLNDEACVACIAKMADDMVASVKNGGKIIFAGNGGSYADSIHLAGEMVARFTLERAPIASVALGANNSILTAVGNDYTYEDIFVRELRALGKPEDIFIGISTSGNSPNIVSCIEAAQEIGMTIYAMTGNKPCKMHRMCDCMKVPSGCTPRIQEAHITAGHIFCEIVERDLFG